MDNSFEVDLLKARRKVDRLKDSKAAALQAGYEDVGDLELRLNMAELGLSILELTSEFDQAAEAKIRDRWSWKKRGMMAFIVLFTALVIYRRRGK